MMRVANTIYMPQLKWKAGEIRALATLPPGLADRTLPSFKITPGGAFDAFEQRTLSTTETIRLFGRRLGQAWARRLAFIDAELIDGERSALDKDVHPLTELLERARIEGANAAPTLSLGSSDDYILAVEGYRRRNPEMPICLRVSLPELESIRSIDTLREFLTRVQGMSEHTVLLIDGGPLHIDDPLPFVHLLETHLARLAPANAWLRVFWSSTTFPNRPKLNAGEIGRFPRNDWELYEAILGAKDQFRVVPLFSDYALEYPGDYKPVKVSPTAHLRYSTNEDYFIFKGATTRKPNGYEAIFPVAQRVLQSTIFHGREFSLGDAYIADLTKADAKTGHASAWRWASTDHHFRVVHAALGRAFSLPATSLETSPAEQLLLV